MAQAESRVVSLHKEDAVEILFVRRGKPLALLGGAGLCLGLSVASVDCGGSPTVSRTPATSAVVEPSRAETSEVEQHRHHHHGGVSMLIAMALRDLDLAPDQRATAEEIRAALFAKMEPARHAGNDLAEILADGVASGAVDRVKADAAIVKLGAASAALHDGMVDAYNRMHDILDADQRRVLIDHLQVHWANWKDAQEQSEQAAESKPRYPGHLAVLTQKLGLSEAQVGQIKENYLSGMTVVHETADHEAVDAHLRAFAAAFKAKSFDAKTLSSEQEANAHMATWGATRMERFFEAFAPVLTPAQRAELAQEIRDHANRHGP